MARHDPIIAFIWIALGVFLCAESSSLGIGGIMEPGPGFMPFVMGAVMIGLAIALFFESYLQTRKIPSKKISLWSDVYWKRVVYVAVIMLAYAVLLPKLGYLLDTFVLMVLLLKSGATIKWPTAIFVGALTAGFSYVLFGTWLHVPFPRGILGF
jgi:putative tricarboxylic transport membrane protein